MKAVHRKITIIFIIILLLGFLLRIWGITSSDLQNDAALNALRSFAWLDYLPNPGQTSPMIWFGEIPWWGNLSFHDMPPLVMLIQNVFFKIFGANTLGASLPFIFSGVGVLSLLYFLLKK